MHADIFLVHQEACDGVRDTTDAQLNGGPVRNQLCNVAADEPLHLTGFDGWKLKERRIVLDHEVDVPDVDGGVAIGSGKVFIDLQDDHIRLLYHFPLVDQVQRQRHVPAGVRRRRRAHEHVDVLGSKLLRPRTVQVIRDEGRQTPLVQVLFRAAKVPVLEQEGDVVALADVVQELIVLEQQARDDLHAPDLILDRMQGGQKSRRLSRRHGNDHLVIRVYLADRLFQRNQFLPVLIRVGHSVSFRTPLTPCMTYCSMESTARSSSCCPFSMTYHRMPTVCPAPMRA